jgi:hypothetical protein
VDKPIKAHIEWLQKKLEILAASQMAAKNKEERKVLEMDIRAIKLALAHYKSAIELERNLQR